MIDSNKYFCSVKISTFALNIIDSVIYDMVICCSDSNCNTSTTKLLFAAFLFYCPFSVLEIASPFGLFSLCIHVFINVITSFFVFVLVIFKFVFLNLFPP